ncbi:hypothetical protein D9615_002489 [Tricholomella constricta]|uniref:Enhancer of polycomb-like protein n=1 Tax=Tricholomella constricta TaxID=117010 RepID=A0A8H5HLX7_9AGAR|nr:hypothetical protein D9615_002489 [Tricholomella constricta]
MARLTGASTRNRHRPISFKARVRIVHGDLEADPLYILDEDEERHHFTNLVAGVDAEDANEHHLQAVLNESQNHAPSHRPARGAGRQNAPPVAYIPTPGSTGVVGHYSDLYPPNRWKDPVTYLCSSITPEESCSSAIANGFTYYMDERDKEWLDKNNEEARGEGTSAQGALSASSTRTSARSAKAKGKEPEPSHALSISEDEFELVMGVFEKVTHEKTEYLHHSLETGMTFPAFSDYQDTFSSPLPPSTFTSYSVPAWTPPPGHLLRIARTIYPYWKERRIERGGHTIIPTLNGDETDTLNESYVCFRRREIKTVRKTRASQATSSDKLIRLQSELAYPLELAKHIFQREHLKRDAVQHARIVGNRRLGLAEFKRKYPYWGDKADEDLLVDKEKPKKADLPRPPKIRTEQGQLNRPEVVALRPTERLALINEAMETRLARQKEQDHHWEDQVDNPYQALLVPHPARFFKYIPVNASSSNGRPNLENKRVPRAVRPRRGRGGRLHVDRRDFAPRPVSSVRRSSLFEHEDEDVEMESEDDERIRRMEERWRFDMDDTPTIGPDGPEEQSRVLIDDYSPKILRYSMTLLLDPDQQNLINDAAIPIINDGRQQMVVPFRLGLPPPQLRRGPGAPRPGGPQGFQKPSPAVSALSNGTPISIQQQLKKMPPPNTLPSMRISSNGGMRPPPVVASMQSSSSLQSSPPNPAALSHSSPSASNGIGRAAINLPHIDASKLDSTGAQVSSSAIQIQQPAQSDQPHNPKPNSTALLHSQPQGMAMNGGASAYHLTPQAAAALVNSAQFTYPGSHGLSLQQVQNLKTAFANAQVGQDPSALKGVARALPPYLQTPGVNFNVQQMAAASNINLKLPPSRQMQWVAGTPSSMKTSPVMAEGQGAGQIAPVRTPSANGTRPVVRIGVNAQLAGRMSPHVQPSSSPISGALHSPPRLPLTPTLPRASPLLQHQQSAGSSKSGY